MFTLRHSPDARAAFTPTRSASEDEGPSAQSDSDERPALPRWRFGLVVSRFVLPVPDVQNRRFQPGLVVDVSPAAPFRPPVLSNDERPRWPFPLRLQFLQPPRAPCFELRADPFGMAIRAHDDMQVIGAAIDGMKLPAALFAVIGNRVL